MTPKEAAEKLDGNQYREEGSSALWDEMKTAGLVAVFGASDDLTEFRGAIDDERGAYGGASYYLTPDGLLEDCEDTCTHYRRAFERSTALNAIWAEDDFAWQYVTSIPHEKFVIREDDEPYCEGIVFALADVPA